MIDLKDSKRVLRDKLEDAHGLAKYIIDLEEGAAKFRFNHVLWSIETALRSVRTMVGDEEDEK